jgi:hypothetical protein
MEGLTLPAPNLQLRPEATPTSPEVPALDPESQKFYEDNPDLRLLFDDKFRDKLKVYWQIIGTEEAEGYSKNTVPPSDEVLNAEVDRALAREMSFFAKVYNGVMTVSNRGYEKVAVLFDTDKTIRDAGFLADGQGAQLARPAFPLVINVLSEKLGSRFEFGLLTTIPAHGLNPEDSLKWLSDVEEKVNPQLIISSTNYFNPRTTKEDPVEQDDKSAIIIDLASRRQNSNTAILLVDDIPSEVRRLNEAGSLQVGGVWVGPEVHDDMWRNAITQPDLVAA